jgi:hypothetical protein
MNRDIPEQRRVLRKVAQEAEETAIQCVHHQVVSGYSLISILPAGNYRNSYVPISNFSRTNVLTTLFCILTQERHTTLGIQMRFDRVP